MSIEIECAFWSSFKEKMGLSPKKCTFFETEHNVWRDLPKPMKILFIFQRGLKGSDEEKLGAPQEKRRTSRFAYLFIIVLEIILAMIKKLMLQA